MFHDKDKTTPNYAKNHTKSEWDMWWLLLLGYYMPRHSIHGWNLDWYSPLWRVSIEVDGSWHDRRDVQAKDRIKKSALKRKGIYTLSVPNKRANRSNLLLGFDIVAVSLLWSMWRIVRFWGKVLRSVLI